MTYGLTEVSVVIQISCKMGILCHFSGIPISLMHIEVEFMVLVLEVCCVVTEDRLSHSEQSGCIEVSWVVSDSQKAPNSDV